MPYSGGGQYRTRWGRAAHRPQTTRQTQHTGWKFCASHVLRGHGWHATFYCLRKPNVGVGPRQYGRGYKFSTRSRPLLDFFLLFFILTLFRIPQLKIWGIQCGWPALHSAESIHTLLSFGAIGGVIFDFTPLVFIVSACFMQRHEEDATRLVELSSTCIKLRSEPLTNVTGENCPVFTISNDVSYGSSSTANSTATLVRRARRVMKLPSSPVLAN